jgi:hypothetical protein
MLPIIGITLLIVFIILWRTGILDDLQKGNRFRESGSKTQESKQLITGSTDTDMNKRLEVFREFIDELPDNEVEE